MSRSSNHSLVLVNAIKLHQGPLRLPTGNFQYVLNLAGELVRSEDFDIRFITDLDSHEPIAERVPESQLIRTQLQGNSIIAADICVSRIIRKMRPAIYHRPTGQLPFFPFPCRTVAGIADLNFMALPHPLLKRLYKEISYRWTIKRANRLICISHYTQNDVRKRFHCPLQKLRVVYLGANDLPLPDKTICARISDKYWLAFAHQHHKNAELCLRAFAEYRRKNSNVALVLIGQNEYVETTLKPLAHDLGLDNRVAVFIGAVTPAELSGLYQSAIGLLFPSRFEGFGLPVLEAMQMSCPVICSNVCSLPEVAGDAAIMIAPDDLEGMVEAMQNIASDSATRSYLIAAGLRQARQFTWKKAAKETTAVYRELLEWERNK